MARPKALSRLIWPEIAEERHSHGRWAVSVFLGLALLEQVTLRRQPSYETAGGGEVRC
jgi:hypothetical protein